MISWLQNYFLKHGKWIFSLLLAVVIVAFVLTITPAGGGLTGSGQKVRRQDFFGFNLASDKDVRSMLTGTEISIWLNMGNRRRRQEQTEQLAFERTACLALANEFGIPGPTDEQMKDYIRSKRSFTAADGKFSQEKYTRFIDLVKSDPNLTEDRVVQTMIEDYRIDKVRAFLAGPGYVLPYEAKKQVEQLDTVWSVAVATLDFNEFNSEITIEETALQEFFESNSFHYEEEPKVQVTAIKFKSSEYTEGIDPPSEDELQEYFEKNEARFKSLSPSPQNNGLKGAEPPAVNAYLEVREEVKKTWIEEKAKRLAAEAADSFTVRLYQESIAKDSETFNKLVKEYRGESVELSPYARNQRPPSELPSRAFDLAFSLNEDRYFSDVIPDPEGATVLVYNGRIGSRIPPLEEVRERVEKDYRQSERKRLFAERGKVIKGVLETALKEGKTLGEAANAEGLTVESFEELTRRNPLPDFDRALFAQIENLEIGQISPMTILKNKGKLVLLKSKKVPPLTEESPEVENIINQTTSFLNAIHSQVLISEIVSNELERSEQP